MDNSHFKAPNLANNPSDDKFYVQIFKQRIWGVYLVFMAYTKDDYLEDRAEAKRQNWEDEDNEK